MHIFFIRPSQDLAEGHQIWGKDPAWRALQQPHINMGLYLVNIKSFLLFSDSNSHYHFLFRIGWTLLRKLKNRFEVSSFGLLLAKMKIFQRLGFSKLVAHSILTFLM